jgi:hypothetical protein
MPVWIATLEETVAAKIFGHAMIKLGNFILDAQA